MARQTRRESVDLADTLDRVLNTGAVVRGDLVICVADVDLLYIDLAVLVSSVETALASGASPRLSPQREETDDSMPPNEEMSR